MSSHNIPFPNIKMIIILNMQNLQLWDLFQGTQERVRSSRGKRAISVRAIEVLLYYTRIIITTDNLKGYWLNVVSSLSSLQRG